jgi:hypothetical protein
VEPRPGRRSPVDGELLVQGQVLEGELAVATDEEGEEPKQVEQERDHRAGILSGSRLRSNHLTVGLDFGEAHLDISTWPVECFLTRLIERMTLRGDMSEDPDAFY